MWKRAAPSRCPAPTTCWASSEGGSIFTLTEILLGWFEDLTFWDWLLAALFLLAVEIFTGTGVLLWAGLAALLTGFISMAAAPDWRVQIGIFSLFAWLLIVAGGRVTAHAGGGESGPEDDSGESGPD